MDVFDETLRSWQNFYFMVGGASAALVGLMFVGLSLGMHLVSETTRKNFQLFVTPSIFYFVSVLVLACVMLVPSLTPEILALLLFGGGIFGLVVTLQHVRLLVQTAKQYGDFDKWDWLAQIILPVLVYVLIILAAICFLINQWSFAFIDLWVTTILLLICAIANTWGLVIWIVDQRAQ